MPVIVVRGEAGAFHAFENRCAHRRALIAFEDAGTKKEFTCVYHAWRYDLEGNLRLVAFQRGVSGKGAFCLEQHGSQKLRIDTIGGLVSGTLLDAAPSLPDCLVRISPRRSAACCRSPRR